MPAILASSATQAESGCPRYKQDVFLNQALRDRGTSTSLACLLRPPRLIFSLYIGLDNEMVSAALLLAAMFLSMITLISAHSNGRYAPRWELLEARLD